jgi:tetratricopeptide (TPR) repeat protein
MKSIEQSSYIKRLKERLSQRPDSKLFLSLAEELRKAERIDEAITLLVEGVKKNPDFVAAHVTLGRWYLSKGMVAEAKEEFLEAAERSPQNIFAHKGLVEAYKKLGDAERAIEECRKVLAVDPLDEEARTCLADSGHVLECAEAQLYETASEGEECAAVGPLEVPQTLECGGEATKDAVVEPEAVQDTEDVPVSLGARLSTLLSETAEVPELADSSPAIESAEAQMVELEDEEKENAAAGLAIDEASVPQSVSSSALLPELAQAPVRSGPSASDLLQEADGYIAEGRFAKAMQLYQHLLFSEPGQKTVLQKREELRSLMKLTGYDSGRIIARLNRFSELIKDRFVTQRVQRKEIAVGRLNRLLGSLRSLGQAQAS